MNHTNRKRIAVFASGNGSNFQSIADAVKKGELKCVISLLVCDNPKAKVLKRAKSIGVQTLLVERKDFKTRQEFEGHIVSRLRKEKVALIVLAGYMRILSPAFVRAFKNKIVNIHPALLPAFKGATAIRDAYRYGVKLTGVTVHIVDENIDNGPILAQVPVQVKGSDSLETLEKRIHAAEHILYPMVLDLLLSKKIRCCGRRVTFTHR